MRTLLRSVFPPRLGRDFRWLIASSWTTNLGDGIAMAAGPLLVEAATDNPGLVGMAWLLIRLPWLLFGLGAGVVADRFDRQKILLVANAVRVVVLLGLAWVIGGGSLHVAVIFAGLFAVGCAEVFVDNTASTLMPMVVPADELTLANSRMTFGFMTLNQLAGPAVGATLFVIGMWVPFAAQGIITAAGVLMVLQVAGAAGRPEVADAAESMSDAIRAGVRWLRGNARVRTLSLLIFVFNLTFGSSFALLVVLARDRLGLSEVGFGLLVSVSAVGGAVGSALFHRTERRIGIVSIMRIGLTIEVLTHLVLATTTVAAVAFGMLFVFGVHAAMWGTLSTSIRHAAVPTDLQGRVSSVYQLGLHGGLVIGAGMGSLLAGFFGATAPFWFGFVGSAMTLTVVWREIGNIAVIESTG